jgi:hypothetical protein
MIEHHTHTPETKDPVVVPDERLSLPNPGRKNLVIPLGLAFIAIGIVASASVLQKTILFEDMIEPHSRRALALGCCRLLLIGFGAMLLWRRPRVTVIHLSAFAFMGLVTAVAGVLLLQIVYVPPRIVCGWRSFAPATEQNQLGFRGRKINYSPDDFVVVFLGDSSVEGMALSPEAMPEQRLESHLNALGKNVKVFSLGAGGYGQDQELLVLEEYFQKCRADLVVLWQTPVNDVWNNVFKTHMINRNPKPTFWLEGGGLRGPSETMGQPLANSHFVLAALWQRAFGLPGRDKYWERGLPEPYVPIDYYDGPVNMEWQERWKSNLGRMRDENLATEKSHLSIMLSPRSKRMQYGLDLTHALTQRIQQVVNAQHGKLVLFQADPHLLTSNEDQMYALNGKYYRVSKRQLEDNWNYVNQGFQTEIVPVTVNDWRVGPEDGHLNRAATDQVMEDLARRLQQIVPNKTALKTATL